MTGDKTQRDAVNKERSKDIYVHASQEPWLVSGDWTEDASGNPGDRSLDNSCKLFKGVKHSQARTSGSR